MSERISMPMPRSQQAHLSLSHAPVFSSRTLNRHSEHIIVEAIIVPEPELRNVKMQKQLDL